MTDPQTLRTERLANWGQTPATSTPDLDSATALIARLGLVTLYPVSPELPNLLQNGDELTGDGWAIVEALRASWQANTEAQLWEADSKLPALSTERPAIRHKSEIQPTDTQRVIDWYISQVSIEEALEDIGLTVDGRARAYLCPYTCPYPCPTRTPTTQPPNPRSLIPDP